MSKNKETKKLIRTIRKMKIGDELNLFDKTIIGIDEKNVVVVDGVEIYDKTKEEVIKWIQKK